MMKSFVSVLIAKQKCNIMDRENKKIVINVTGKDIYALNTKDRRIVEK